jgi:tetratricopeptide (TPR) repeat protein
MRLGWRTTTCPAPQAPAGRRSPLLLQFGQSLAVLSLAGFLALAGLWWYWRSSPPMPEVSQLDLRSADPEVAEAITEAREAVLRAPRSAAAWGRLGMVLHVHSYLPETIPCYRAATALDTRAPLWPYLEALVHLEGPEPAAALPGLARAAALSPPDALPRMRLADLLLQQDRFDEALAEYHKGLAANPDNAHAQLGLAQLAVAQQRYRDALPYLKAVTDDQFARKRACALEAVVHERLGDGAAAERARKRLAELPEDEPWPDAAVQELVRFHVGLMGRLDHAQLLQRQDKLADALTLLREAVARYPRSDVAWSTLGRALGHAKDFPGAEQAMLKSTELAPQRPDHWLYLGAARREQGKYKGATEALRRAVELGPTDATAHFEIGQCLEAQGDRASAAESYRLALRYRPDMAEARQRLAALAPPPAGH